RIRDGCRATIPSTDRWCATRSANRYTARRRRERAGNCLDRLAQRLHQNYPPVGGYGGPGKSESWVSYQNATKRGNGAIASCGPSERLEAPPPTHAFTNRHMQRGLSSFSRRNVLRSPRQCNEWLQNGGQPSASSSNGTLSHSEWEPARSDC